MNITDINGVGPTKAKLLSKLNIFTVDDMVSYYPYRYNTYSLAELFESDMPIMVKGIIESVATVSYIKKNFNKLSFRININNQIIKVVIFNRAFMKNNLLIGKEAILIGKYSKKSNTFTASDIKFNIHDGDIEPIYHLTKGLSNNEIRKILFSSLKYNSVGDYIPSDYIKKYDFISKDDALNIIHFPKNYLDIEKARSRLIYEELFSFSFKMNYLNNNRNNNKGIAKEFDDDKINRLIDSLPFKLTDDQLKVLGEIFKDLRSNNKMNRLLLGDVGSGKTIVSAISIYASFLGGFQSAFMAPTEILALQHFFSIKKLLEKYGVVVEVITGSMTKREKEKIYERVSLGQIDLLIGTHAILNELLSFNNLGLVITDEQHRFGVNQRNILQKKGSNPDILYLSATPIPRTYAMTIYGDLDISMIKSKPIGRKDIITTVKNDNEIKDVLLAMLEEIKKGHQVYIVSPLVDQNDELDLKSVTLLKEKIDVAFHGLIRSEIIHGKMKQNQKDAIMNDFKNNVIKILISTTVIEVGIDVPNATMTVIYNAERFGLATLHQLRGRVGRSELQSYCYLISNKDNERLKVMEESNDGFYIAEKDFEMRGHGDLFGTRQSGDMIFKIADLRRNYDTLVSAKNDSTEYIKNGKYKDSEYYKNIADNLDIAY